LGFEAFLKALPEAAKSPLGLTAFAFALAVWAFRVWHVQRPQQQAKNIIAKFSSDQQRLDALRLALKEDPPAGLSGEAAILDWVKIQAKAKSAGFLLVAYIASLAAIVLVVVIALMRPGAGRAVATVRLIDQADDSCVQLSSGAQLVVVVAGKSQTVPIVNGCEAQVSWLAGDGPTAATFSLQGTPAFHLSEPDRVHWLAPNKTIQIDAVSALGVAPRVKILLMPYVSGEGGNQDRGEFLRRMMESKLHALSEQLGNEPSSPVKNLLLILSTESGPLSDAERRKKWVSGHLLEISSGILFSKDGHLMARGDLYLGELAEPSSFELDMPLDPSAFKRANDSHALALVYALAADAERIKQPEHLIATYLQRATALCQELVNEQGEGIKNLKRSVASLMGRWDKTSATSCN
jgi:hypothetical protein